MLRPLGRPPIDRADSAFATTYELGVPWNTDLTGQFPGIPDGVVDANDFFLLPEPVGELSEPPTRTGRRRDRDPR